MNKLLHKYDHMPTNQQQLIALKKQYKLSYTDLSEITGKSWYTVKSWLLQPSSEASRTISNNDLEKIKHYKGD